MAYYNTSGATSAAQSFSAGLSIVSDSLGLTTATSARGLSNFIGEIRNCEDKASEVEQLF